MGGKTKTKSSVSIYQKPIAQDMLDIFKHYLAGGLPDYPGAAGVRPFSPSAVASRFQQDIRNRLMRTWNQNLAGTIGPAAQDYANLRLGQQMDILEAQAQRQGQGMAYQEWLRTRPETGPAMNLGLAFLNQPQTTAQMPSNTGAIYGTAAAINAIPTIASLWPQQSAGVGSILPGAAPNPWNALYGYPANSSGDYYPAYYNYA